jgi:hypothetical protein
LGLGSENEDDDEYEAGGTYPKLVFVRVLDIGLFKIKF